MVKILLVLLKGVDWKSVYLFGFYSQKKRLFVCFSGYFHVETQHSDDMGSLRICPSNHISTWKFYLTVPLTRPKCKSDTKKTMLQCKHSFTILQSTGWHSLEKCFILIIRGHDLNMFLVCIVYVWNVWIILSIYQLSLLQKTICTYLNHQLWM